MQVSWFYICWRAWYQIPPWTVYSMFCTHLSHKFLPLLKLETITAVPPPPLLCTPVTWWWHIYHSILRSKGSESLFHFYDLKYVTPIRAIAHRGPHFWHLVGRLASIGRDQTDQAGEVTDSQKGALPTSLVLHAPSHKSLSTPSCCYLFTFKSEPLFPHPLCGAEVA